MAFLLPTFQNTPWWVTTYRTGIIKILRSNQLWTQAIFYHYTLELLPHVSYLRILYLPFFRILNPISPCDLQVSEWDFNMLKFPAGLLTNISYRDLSNPLPAQAQLKAVKIRTCQLPFVFAHLGLSINISERRNCSSHIKPLARRANRLLPVHLPKIGNFTVFNIKYECSFVLSVSNCVRYAKRSKHCFCLNIKCICYLSAKFQNRDRTHDVGFANSFSSGQTATGKTSVIFVEFNRGFNFRSKHLLLRDESNAKPWPLQRVWMRTKNDYPN